MKMRALEQKLREYKRIAVAFSGGVDSSLLLATAVRVLGKKNVLAIHIHSVFSARRESAFARELADKIGATYVELKLEPLAHESIRVNSPSRCYHCKRLLMSRALEIARVRNFDHLSDGTNYDDRDDYRPGMRAADELGVLHLLADFTKKEIRSAAESLQLPNAQFPAAACLASRVPTGTALDEDKLKVIDAAENLLRDMGFDWCRVRFDGTKTRLEFGETCADQAQASEQAIRTALHAFPLGKITFAPYKRGSANAQEVPEA